MTTRLLPTPSALIEHLGTLVHHQPRAKRDLAVAAYNHYLGQVERTRGGGDLGRQHILLLGPTGVGKTLLVRTLAEYLGVPFGFASAAGLVEAGFKGNSVDTLVQSLLDRAGGDPRLAERGIVFLDEVDKIRCADMGGSRDISGEGVQNALLTLLDGRISEGSEGARHPPVDTSKLLFVCAGAFVGLDDIVRARLDDGRRELGFRVRLDQAEETVTNQPVYEALRQVETRDLVEFGMIPEFIGRFSTITVLHELSRDALRSILGGAVEGSALARRQRFACLHGIELVFEADALDGIAEEAEALGTGARGLHRLVGNAVRGVDHRWSELADQGVTRVTITRAVVTGAGDPLLEFGTTSTCTRQDDELRQAALQDLPPRPAQEGGNAGGVRDASKWPTPMIRSALERTKVEKLDWESATGRTRLWWEAFERENVHRLPLVLRLADELARRGATINEFFDAYLDAKTDNIQACLHFLDYWRLKKQKDEEETRQRERASRAQNDDYEDELGQFLHGGDPDFDDEDPDFDDDPDDDEDPDDGDPENDLFDDPDEDLDGLPDIDPDELMGPEIDEHDWLP